MRIGVPRGGPCPDDRRSGRLGLVPDPATGRRRVVQGLIFTAVYSRHLFVYPTLRQTLDEVVAGFEAAWLFFGGVFAIVVPDNMKTIVIRSTRSIRA